jgi:carboxypeptidase T
MRALKKILFLSIIVLFFSTVVAEKSPSSNVSSQSTAASFQEARYYQVYFDNLDSAHKVVISMITVETEYEKGYVVVEVSSQEEYDRLLQSGLKLKEISNPLTEKITAMQDAALLELTGIPAYPCYRTVEETFATAEGMATTYPNLATWTDRGDSWEKTNGFGGFDMKVLLLTNSTIAGPKPKLFLTGAIHAREYTTAELITRFAEYLVENYGSDPEATWILDHHEIHLMLHANPDGRKQSETGLSWRKNTNQDYCGATSNSRGADLNRNFPFKWNCCGGSSGTECSTTFRGAAPASEPETQAIRDYMLAQFPDQRGPNDSDPAPLTTSGIYLDIHSSGKLVIWPWGWTSDPAPNATELQTLGRKFAYFNDHTPKQAYGLYPTDGTTKLFGYGELGIPSYTIELGTQFFESCTYFENTLFPDNMNSLLWVAKVLRTPYITPSGPDSINLTLSAGSTPTGVPAGTIVTISGSIDDTRFNNSNGTEPSQNIFAAEYYKDVPPWVTSPTPVAIAMSPSDGTFDSPSETVQANIDTTNWTEGQYILYVRGQDTEGNWGPFSAVFLYINNTVDTDPPTPDPMTFVSVPTATGSYSISMIATTASDASGVEYYFECSTPGGHDSGWQDSSVYEDTELSSNTSYSYRIKARDKSPAQNETGWSLAEIATTDPLPEWTELTYDDFEAGFGNFTDGGRDCRLYPGGTHAHQGSNAANIQDNSGAMSSFYLTNGVDIHTTGYTQIKVEFWFKAVSMESGEDFWVQYYDGSSWHTVATYTSSTFNNNTFYNETIFIDETGYNFPTDMKIRFMCDAGANNDDVYIDEVRVSVK